MCFLPELQFFFHGRIADPDGPDIGACLGDHQHPDHGHGIRPEHHRDIEPEAQDNGQPHPAEGLVPLLFGAVVEQHNDHQAQQGKGDVPVDAPGKGRLGAEPLVLGHHAEGHPGRRQAPDCRGQAVFAADLIPGPPDVVEQHIKDGHGHRGDPLAQAQGHGVILQAGGAKGQGPGHQMEGVPRPQQDGHGAEEGELGIALAAPEHPDAQGDDGGQIDRIKKCFHNGLYKLLLFFKKANSEGYFGSILVEKSGI